MFPETVELNDTIKGEHPPVTLAVTVGWARESITILPYVEVRVHPNEFPVVSVTVNVPYCP